MNALGMGRNHLSIPGYKYPNQFGMNAPAMGGYGGYPQQPQYGFDGYSQPMLGDMFGSQPMGYMGRTRRPNMPYGQRMGMFRPYLEQTQPFAGL